MYKVNYLLLIILIWTQYSFWLGKNGVLDFIHVYKTIDLSKNLKDISQMKDRNNKLLLEIHNLICKYDLIEEYARFDLGMVKSDEIFYDIKVDN